MLELTLMLSGPPPSKALLGTAKLNGLDPAAWLKDTLEKPSQFG